MVMLMAGGSLMWTAPRVKLRIPVVLHTSSR